MEKIKITISSVLNDLSNSMTREEIRDKYSLTNAQLKQLFQHPQLKGRKTKQVNVLFEIVDDVTKEESVVTETVEVVEAETVTEITNPTTEEIKVDNSILSTFE